MTKKCIVYETLGSVTTMQVQESQADKTIRLSGVFGVCGIKNGNNRIYSKQNYGQMVESLQKVIATEGCLGELEHPNSMNIDLNNVSHKIESIEMNEDGTITGTIQLLDTDKGRNAQAIVKAGVPLYISSRALGSIDESGHVTLTMLKTYDLVGTPGFAQAKLNLTEGQKFESLNESLENGNISWMIVEGEDNSDNKTNDPKDGENDDNKNKDNNKTTMNEIANKLDEVIQKVTSLEAALHVAQESLQKKDEEIANLNSIVEALKPTNYEAIEKWITEEFAPEFKTTITESICTNVQNWVTEEFAPEVQTWVTEEFAPQVQNWITEEFAPEVQTWITEEFTPQVQNWITEEFAPTIEGWITEEFAPETRTSILNEVNENVSEFFEAQKENKFEAIDKMLSTLESMQTTDAAAQMLKEQQQKNNKYIGVYAVESMPAEYRPLWEMLDESKKDEIALMSRAYDFTKKGVLESFWANVNFKPESNTQTIQESANPQANYMSNIAAQMRKLR